MNKNFKTLNEEISRIKELLNINISEQKTTVTPVSTFRLSSSKQVYSDFISKYLKEKLPNLTNDLLLSERIELLTNFMKNDSLINNTKPIQYFRSIGYKNNDERIKDFQSEIGIQTIKSLQGVGNFIDGDFGVGTVKASLQIAIDRQNELLKRYKDVPYEKTFASPEVLKQAAAKEDRIEKTKSQIKNINTGDKTQELNIGSQSTH